MAVLLTVEEVRACALVWDGVARDVQAGAHRADSALPAHAAWQGVYADNFRAWWVQAHPGLVTVARVAESLAEGLNRFANVLVGVDSELESGYAAIRGACVEGTFVRTPDGCEGQIAVPAPPAAPTHPTPNPSPEQMPTQPTSTPTSAPTQPPSGPVTTVPDPQPSDVTRPTSCPISVRGWAVTVGDLVSPSTVPALGTAYAHFGTAQSRYQAGGTSIAFDLVVALAAIDGDTAFPPLKRGEFPDDGDPTGGGDPLWRRLTKDPSGTVLFRPGTGGQFDFDNDNVIGSPPDWYQPVHEDVPWEQKLAEKIDEVTHALSGPLAILSLVTLAVPGLGEEELGAIGLRALRGITLLDSGGKVVGDLATGKPSADVLKDVGGFGLESSEAVTGLSTLIVSRIAPDLKGEALNEAIGTVSTLVYDHSVPEAGGEGREITQDGIDAVTTEAKTRLALLAATANP